MLKTLPGVLAIGALIAGGVVRAQTPASLVVNSVDELLVNLTLTAGPTDAQLQRSTDLERWVDVNLFVPAGRTLDLPVDNGSPESGYFRLIEAAPEPLEVGVPVIGGMTLGVAGFTVYQFREDGSGVVAAVQGRGDPTAFYEFTWTELDAQPGLVTVRTTSADGYLEVLHIQFLAVGQITAFITTSEGPGGSSFSTGVEFVELTMSALLGTAPASLEGTTWSLAREGVPAVTVSFEAGGVATGPDLATGVPSSWSYSYIPTGTNTATLEVTDAAGNFGRFFLIFDGTGEAANIGMSASAVEGLFGEAETRGDFTLVP